MTKEEKREYDRKYYQENKDKRREYQNQYNNEHRERKKQYRLDHADEIREYMKQYRLDHADEIKEYKREYQNQHNSTKGGRAAYLLHRYNAADRNRGFDTADNITPEWITANVFSGQSCIYCGETDWHKLGCDRIDNNKPHTPDNVVCCCGKCNNERGTKYTVEDFKKIKMGEVVATSPETSPL